MKLGRAFKNTKLKKKLLFTYLMIALIPLIIFGGVLAVIGVDSSKDKTDLYALQVAEQVNDSIDIYIGSIEQLMDTIITEAENKDNTLVTEDFLKRLKESYPEIAGITLAYYDDSYLCAGMTRNSRDLFRNETWYKAAMHDFGKLTLGSAVGRNVITTDEIGADRTFSMCKAFENGVLLLDIRHLIIEGFIDKAAIGQNGFVYIVDKNGDVVYAPANEIVYRIPSEKLKDNMRGQEINIKGSKYYLYTAVSDRTGWISVAVIPEEEFLSNLNGILTVLFITALASVILVTFVSFMVSDNLTEPISELTDLMSKVEEGDMDVRFTGTREDEVGQLGESFNHMIERMDTLVQELADEKQSKLMAELKSLQEQFKPHFLYNTLDTIGWMARSYNATDIVKIIEALTNIFRIGLSKGRDFITLREEKAHVENYLYIQKIRYKETLKYTIGIPDTYDDVILPKLILQPLVENAIYHGIKLKRGGGTIFVTGYEKENDLFIEIKDDGAGVAPEKLEVLKKQLLEEGQIAGKDGFGLFYVAERVKMCYGEPYGLTIDSVFGEGTTVTLRLPLNSGGSENG